MRCPANIPQPLAILGNNGIVFRGVFSFVGWRKAKGDTRYLRRWKQRGTELSLHPTLPFQSLRQQGCNFPPLNIGSGPPRRAAQGRTGRYRSRTRPGGASVYERCSLCSNPPTRVKSCFDAEGNPISRCDPSLPSSHLICGIWDMQLRYDLVAARWPAGCSNMQVRGPILSNWRLLHGHAAQSQRSDYTSHSKTAQLCGVEDLSAAGRLPRRTTASPWRAEPGKLEPGSTPHRSRILGQES